MKTIYDYKETEMSGKTIDLSAFKNKVLVIVNTASKCGLAPQLEGLEKLYKKYKDDGLVILGLPSNQFHQELDTDEEADDYCRIHYGVTFLMTQRVAVNGADEIRCLPILKNNPAMARLNGTIRSFSLARTAR